ncbi:MAG TPA: septal ring lytic transglycosylase RlpA family protein [Silvibacterium sp.]|jgi:rare lipoprotein A|nr:septal ring lytic transglycosylase RlpA family protein [Silvibacterium sp.]
MNSIAMDKLTRSRRFAFMAGAAFLTILGISGAPAGNASPSVKIEPQHHWFQIGRASWYGRLFQGRATANGENFNMNELTCAHRSLPMGSLVRVTNLSNQKSVVVRVNDRGPIPRSRVIDLSYAAARFLGFSSNGTAPVRLELLKDDPELAQIVFPNNSSQISPLAPTPLVPSLVR